MSWDTTEYAAEHITVEGDGPWSVVADLRIKDQEGVPAPNTRATLASFNAMEQAKSYAAWVKYWLEHVVRVGMSAGASGKLVLPENPEMQAALVKVFKRSCEHCVFWDARVTAGSSRPGYGACRQLAGAVPEGLTFLMGEGHAWVMVRKDFCCQGFQRKNEEEETA